MIIAREADDDVTAAASGAEYPRFFICGINTEPSAATSATAEPDISAKKRLTPMLTIARPPRTKPMMAFTKLMSLSVIPPAFMIAPAKTNIGMAINENLVDPSYISSASVTILSTPSVTARPKMAATARPTAIGTLIQISATKITNIIKTIMI